jgi:hypothetical protein
MRMLEFYLDAEIEERGKGDLTNWLKGSEG